MAGDDQQRSAPPQPARFRAARDLRSLTQAEVVDRMAPSISAAALSQFESGKTRPTAETMAELARVLQVPVGFFSIPWPGAAGGSPPTYFRDLRATSLRERRRAASMAVLLNDLLTAIESHVRLPEVRVPSHPVTGSAERGEIEAVADAVRREWNLGLEPIPHVVRLLERHGIPVARLTMGHRLVDGFSVRFNRRPLVILATDKSNYVRSRFDASHELAHLVMHAGAEPGDRVVESQAQDFASCFLLPREAALQELPTKLDASGWSRLAQMKRHWGMSMAALLYRARGLGLGQEAHRNAMKYMSAKGWRTVEPGDREMGQPEAPLLLERALRTVAIESGQPVEEILRTASLPAVDTMDLIAAAVDRRPTIEL